MLITTANSVQRVIHIVAAVAGFLSYSFCLKAFVVKD